MREDGRSADELRPVTFELHFTKWAEGSVLTKFGNTHVLCNVTIEDTLPRWLKNQPKPHGWLTAEYAMLPRSTQQRTMREQRWPKGRTQEISRLIGRSLRMALDLYQLGERTLTIDCDVLQADGGTRTAAITGSWLAVKLALQPLIRDGILPDNVFKHQIAAISVGVVGGEPLLDLPYVEDVAAEVDMNVVMTGEGKLVEVQGTAEKAPADRQQFNRLMDLAALGIEQLVSQQRTMLSGEQ
ncbi:MAG: ribonuclease PH [Anaerolineales bacterium]|nr:ribonuclease PH [Anaerolineales bacterium]